VKDNSVGKLLGLEIESELLEAIRKAVAKGEDGITFKEAVALFDIPYHAISAAVHALAEMGKVAFAHRADRNVLRIALPGWEPPAVLELTARQRAIVEYLASKADACGLVSASTREILRGIGAAKGTVVDAVYALEVKGYLKLVARGHGNLSNTYRVWPAGDGPRGPSLNPPMRSPQPSATPARRVSSRP
jgi:phosphoserine phosphatase